MSVDAASSSRLAELTAASFASSIGSAATVALPSGTVDLVVVGVEERPGPGARTGFTIAFEADLATSREPQGTYLVHLPALGAPLPIFLVPRHARDGRAVWEAVFG